MGYACRARTTGPFYDRENLTTAQANYNGKFPYGAFPAGDFRQKTTPTGDVPLSTRGGSPTCTQRVGVDIGLYGRTRDSASANIDSARPASGEKAGDPRAAGSSTQQRALRAAYTHAPQDKGFSLGVRLAADRPR